MIQMISVKSLKKWYFILNRYQAELLRNNFHFKIKQKIKQFANLTILENHHAQPESR